MFRALRLISFYFIFLLPPIFMKYYFLQHILLLWYILLLLPTIPLPHIHLIPQFISFYSVVLCVSCPPAYSQRCKIFTFTRAKARPYIPHKVNKWWCTSGGWRNLLTIVFLRKLLSAIRYLILNLDFEQKTGTISNHVLFEQIGRRQIDVIWGDVS